jgi:hypothetical protein
MRAAGKMMGRLRDWWIRNYHPENVDFERWKESIQFFGVQKSCPPINGIFTENLLEYFGEKRLPAAIAICWLLLLVLTTSVFIQRRANPAYSWVFLVIGCIAIGVGLWILTFKKEKIKYWLESDNDRLQKELIVLHDEIHRVHPRQPTPSQQPNSSCQVSTQD